jgi:glucose/arabinose dehydrogenase
MVGRYYMGSFEDPRRAGERPDLAVRQPFPMCWNRRIQHLQMTFYTANNGPAAFPLRVSGDGFAALHGSWNRATRTGYKLVRIP